MHKIARRRKEGDPRQAWTLVLVFLAYLALTPTIGLISPRSRSAAEPQSASIVTAENEPPTSPLVLPRPPSSAGDPAPVVQSARETAWKAEGAGREHSRARPAPMNNAPAPGTLEILVTLDGRAAPGAWIELGHEAGATPSTALHRADEEGRLALELAPGSVRAVAWSEAASSPPASAALTPGARVPLALELEPAFPVAGRVLDARTGLPVAGAAISFWTLAASDVVHSAADGSFRHPRFPGRAPAQQVCAQAAGYGKCVRYLRVASDGSWKLAAATADEASLTGLGTPWIELALVPELSVRGRILDRRGAPLAGARVGAEGFFHAMPSVASRDEAEARGDDQGRFELAGLRSDIGHTLLVEAPGHARRALELAAGETRLDLGDVVLEPETVLAGVVIDADGMPVEGLEIALEFNAEFNAEVNHELDPGPSPVRAGALDVAVRVEANRLLAHTGPEGTFLFEHLEPRGYALTVRHGERPLLECRVEPALDGTFPEPCLTLPAAAYAFAADATRR